MSMLSLQKFNTSRKNVPQVERDSSGGQVREVLLYSVYFKDHFWFLMALLDEHYVNQFVVFQYKALAPMYYRDAAAALVVYDISNMVCISIVHISVACHPIIQARVTSSYSTDEPLPVGLCLVSFCCFCVFFLTLLMYSVVSAIHMAFHPLGVDK